MSPLPDPRMPGRRAFLLGTGVLLAGCATGPRGPAAPPPDPTTIGAATTGPTAQRTGAAESPSAAMPPRATWSADANDVRPAVKQAATRLIEALGNWDHGDSGPDAAGARVRALGQDPSLVEGVGALVTDADASVLQVIDAQYGGILSDSASVLVVTRTWARSPAGTISGGGATYDVRLSSASPTWRVTEIHPSQPGTPVTPGTLAQEVLSSDRLDLPPASSADIASGQVHDSVLEAMLHLAQTYRLGISVVRSGHPTYVFGTSRPSDHPRGRAFDTWMIDGHPVVASATPQALVTAFMRDAARAGSYNIGGPYVVSGSAYFTDDTHHDHVHAGFTS